MLVASHGYLVFERYYGEYGPSSFFNMASITKSVLSALTGIALRDGLLKALDYPLADTFPEADPRITLRHLLSLTAGWKYREYGPELAPVAERLAQPLTTAPGERFCYEENAPHLLSAILSRLAGMSLAEYARRELFEPLGVWREMERWRDAPGTVNPAGRWPADGLPWKCDAEGVSTGGVGLHLTLRDLARFGLLYASGGVWEARQLIPPDYLRESTRAQSRGGSPMWMPYGWLWWIPAWHRGSPLLAAGWGGQRLYVNKTLDLVTAVVCAYKPGGPADEGGVLDRYLLTAVEDWTA
jgi:CubicO group peptidase (beta-lactamase class C family)